MGPSPAKRDLRPQLTFRVGAIGTRVLAPEMLLALRGRAADILQLTAECLREAADREAARSIYATGDDGRIESRLRLVSPLAGAADRLLAAEALRAGLELHVPFPFPSSGYAKDFGERRLELDALRGRAVLFPLDGDRGRQDESYESAARFVVENSDVLIAVGNGAPAGDRDGAAEIVEYALNLGAPVLYIDAETADVRILFDRSGKGAAAADHPQLSSALASRIRSVTEPPPDFPYRSRRALLPVEREADSQSAAERPSEDPTAWWSARVAFLQERLAVARSRSRTARLAAIACAFAGLVATLMAGGAVSRASAAIGAGWSLAALASTLFSLVAARSACRSNLAKAARLARVQRILAPLGRDLAPSWREGEHSFPSPGGWLFLAWRRSAPAARGDIEAAKRAVLDLALEYVSDARAGRVFAPSAREAWTARAALILFEIALFAFGAPFASSRGTSPILVVVGMGVLAFGIATLASVWLAPEPTRRRRMDLERRDAALRAIDPALPLSSLSIADAVRAIADITLFDLPPDQAP